MEDAAYRNGRMVMMLQKLFSDPKRAALIAGAMIVVVLICVAVIVSAGWLSLREGEQPKPTLTPISIGYCGADPADLCVESFSHDVFGNTVINLFVPAKTPRTFYLNITRRAGEYRFECEWEKRDPTSVNCTGDAIDLGEGFEMQVLSVKDDQLIAQGLFTLTAYLVTTQTADGEPAASNTPAPASTKEASPTPTETPQEDSAAQTATSTEEATDLPEVTETATP